MKAKEYKALCRRIYSRFRAPLKLLYVDACELADLVAWGQKTEDELFLTLQETLSQEAGNGNK